MEGMFSATRSGARPTIRSCEHWSGAGIFGTVEAMAPFAGASGRNPGGQGSAAAARGCVLLGSKELYALLANDRTNPLTEARISVRSRNFELMRSKQAKPPAYIRRGRPVVFASESNSADGGFRCVGTTQSTDPGWTPVFNLLKGIVLETGGMLGHGSRLAREYGFPAVQFPSATQLIPDGALITIDADAGVITIDEPPTAEQPTPHGPPQFMAEARTTRRSSSGAP